MIGEAIFLWVFSGCVASVGVWILAAARDVPGRLPVAAIVLLGAAVFVWVGFGVKANGERREACEQSGLPCVETTAGWLPIQPVESDGP